MYCIVKNIIYDKAMTIDEHLVMVKLMVNGKPYPLRVKADYERYCRKAAPLIEKKISQYRNQYTGADIRKLDQSDYAIMTAIQAVSECENLEEENKIFEERIKSLTKELDEYLKG